MADDPLSGPVELAWAREHVAALGREAYLERYPCPGLLLTLKDGSGRREAARSVSTDSSSRRSVTYKGMQRGGSGDSFGLVLVKKRPGNTLLPLMITVGRDRKADISLNFSTISKTHAFFYAVGSSWVVVDAGSSNGAFVEGLKLTAREPYTLSGGQTIHFGFDVSAVFLPVDELLGYLFES